MMANIEESKYYAEALEQYEETKANAKQLEGLGDYDKRIFNTGCYLQNLILHFCHADTGDWRKCAAEMKWFKTCWEKNDNPQRTFQNDKPQEQYEREVRQ